MINPIRKKSGCRLILPGDKERNKRFEQRLLGTILIIGGIVITIINLTTGW